VITDFGIVISCFGIVVKGRFGIVITHLGRRFRFRP
jgi:hypothetical protein